MSVEGFKKILDFTAKPPPAELVINHPEGGTISMRMAEFPEIEALHELTVSQIGKLVAPLEAMQDVYKHNPETMWVIFRSPSGDRTDAYLAGYYAFLHLNEAGHEALKNRTLRARQPDLGLLAAAGERPVAVYIWAIVAKRLMTLTTPLVGKGLGVKRYGGLPFYATAATMSGLNAVKGFGFKSTTTEDDDKLGDLFHFYMPGESDRSSTSAA